MIEVGGRCDQCKRRTSGYNNPKSLAEYCKICATNLTGLRKQFDDLPEDVEFGYALSDSAATKLDALCDNSGLAQITLYEVFDDGGAYIWVKATGSYSHGMDLYIRPNGTLEPTP